MCSPPFSVQICDVDDASAAWRELENTGSGYQSRVFAKAYAAAFAITLTVAIARDAAGAVVAVVPLDIRRVGFLRIGSLVGGRHTAYHMGLFRREPGLGLEDVAAILRDMGRQAGVDVFKFSYMPAEWAGSTPPLSLLPSQPAPDIAYATFLEPTFEAWRKSNISRKRLQSLRNNRRKLEALGPVRHERAVSAERALFFLEIFFRHKRDKAQAKKVPDPYANPQSQDLLRRLAREGAMEMHALWAGERVIATLGTIACGQRLSGFVISYDRDEAIGAGSPGKWICLEVVRDAIARGFREFDLGYGTTDHYKRVVCKREELMLDAMLAITPAGHVWGRAWLLLRSIKRRIKKSPRLMRLI